MNSGFPEAKRKKKTNILNKKTDPECNKTLGFFVLIVNQDTKAMVNFNIPQGKSIATYPASSSNQITREYYNFLVGEINRGTVLKAVCRIENKVFGTTSHYLISER